jgi:hypothetical protein
MGIAVMHQSFHHKGFKEFQGHFFGQTALMEFQLRGELKKPSKN